MLDLLPLVGKELAAGALLAFALLAICGPAPLWDVPAHSEASGRTGANGVSEVPESLGASKAFETSETAKAEHMHYDTAMVQLVADLRDYAQSKRPGFLLIGNGGTPLLLAENGNTVDNASRYAHSVDGIMAESVLYGWDDERGRETPEEERTYFERIFAMAQVQDLTALTLDYTKHARESRKAHEYAQQHGYKEYTSHSRELDRIPLESPWGENALDIHNLHEIQNYLVLLNPSRYPTKEAYLQALCGTNYDLLILDPFYAGELLRAEDVRSLQQKQNGGRRLVVAYLSIGEAEPWRPYWNPAWETHPPAFLGEKNETWDSYRVRYWTPAWQRILYGTPTSGLDAILTAGFDGAFLDVIDTYAYFQQNEP